MNRAARPLAPGLAVREVAVFLLCGVLDDGHALDSLLETGAVAREIDRLEPRDRRLARAIAATALRRHGEISAVLDRLVARRPRRAGKLFRIIEIAATQLLFMEVPDHAAVSVAMEAVGRDRDARHFRGLANAVLRRLAREKASLLAGLDAPRLNTPEWLLSRWDDSYGSETALRIAEVHGVEPYLDLTVRDDPEGWAKRLDGIVLPTGTVRLAAGGMVSALPGYAEGAWWVQDAAAAIPARLFNDLVGKRVADLCAAPGGKTAQLAAMRDARVTAIDISATRLARLRDNLSRLRLGAEAVEADILAWEPAEAFDAILLDAPCTATGTIRRHPDAAWLKRPEDVAALAALQARMIDRVVPWLKAGGTLVFCTCSLEPEEGEAQLARALDRHPLALLPVSAEEIGGLAEVVRPDGTVRTLPCHLPGASPRLSGLDGFFIARMAKR